MTLAEFTEDYPNEPSGIDNIGVGWDLSPQPPNPLSISSYTIARLLGKDSKSKKGTSNGLPSLSVRELGYIPEGPKGERKPCLETRLT